VKPPFARIAKIPPALSPAGLCLAVLCSVPALLFPLGKKEPVSVDTGNLYDTVQSGQTVELSGTIRLVGSQPFPELVLSDAGGNDWYIARESRALVSGYEQRTVTVRGKAELKEMVLADGRSLGHRRILSELVLLKPKNKPPG
jgi:hypothetical protein